MVIILRDVISDSEASLPCIICHLHHSMDEVTTGSLYADGRQAVACRDHLAHNFRDWVTEWVIFEAVEGTRRLGVRA